MLTSPTFVLDTVCSQGSLYHIITRNSVKCHVSDMSILASENIANNVMQQVIPRVQTVAGTCDIHQ